MTAVEELRAAIVKLTELRDAAHDGPWSVEEIPETGECRLVREFEFFGPQIEVVAPGGMIRDDADLIVTLHRTIDAQLAILQEAATQLTDAYGGAQLGPEFYGNELALARAINGVSS